MTVESKSPRSPKTTGLFYARIKLLMSLRTMMKTARAG